MPRYAAFLRGINITGRRVTGVALCSPLEELGFTGVETFRASGNVIFEADREPVARMTGRIENALRKALGYEVVTFLRTDRQFRTIAGSAPFGPADVEASKGKLQVSMLPAKPSAKARNEVLALATEADRLAFGDQELFWLPSGGTQESELDGKAIEKLIGPTTMRTMGTVEQIAAKYFAG